MRDTKNTKKSIFSHIFDGIKSIFTSIKNVFFKKENGKEKQSLKKQKEQAIEITSKKETINIINITGYSAYIFVDKSTGEEKKSTIWNLPSVPVEDFAKKYCACYTGGDEIAKKNCFSIFSIFRRPKTENNFSKQLKNAADDKTKISIISNISKQAQNEKPTAPNRAAFFKTISGYISDPLYWPKTVEKKAVVASAAKTETTLIPDRDTDTSLGPPTAPPTPISPVGETTTPTTSSPIKNQSNLCSPSTPIACN